MKQCDTVITLEISTLKYYCSLSAKHQNKVCWKHFQVLALQKKVFLCLIQCLVWYLPVVKMLTNYFASQKS